MAGIVVGVEPMDPGLYRVECRKCGGTGDITMRRPDVTKTCPHCLGRGTHDLSGEELLELLDSLS